MYLHLYILMFIYKFIYLCLYISKCTHYTHICWERNKEEMEKGYCIEVWTLYSLGRIIQETDWELALWHNILIVVDTAMSSK